MLGKRLAFLRGNKTQEEVAAGVGISRPRYAHYETGRSEPDIELLIKIADYFNVSLDFLLGRVDNPLPANIYRFDGSKIAIMREAKGMTVNSLSVKTEIDTKRLTAFEAGKAVPNLSELTVISEALGVDKMFFVLEGAVLPSDVFSDNPGIADMMVAEEAAPYIVIAEKAFREGIPPELFERVLSLLLDYKK